MYSKFAVVFLHVSNMCSNFVVVCYTYIQYVLTFCDCLLNIHPMCARILRLSVARVSNVCSKFGVVYFTCVQCVLESVCFL